MPPRIRTLLPRMPHDRKTGTKAKATGEAPRVFREFVETLQRLDARETRPKLARRRRGYVGNGHKKPAARGRA